MPGTREGVLRGAATHLGLTLEEYLGRIEAGLKWCTGCRAWHDRSAFSRDRTTGDGLKTDCVAASRARPRRKREKDDRLRARVTVHRAYQRGDLPHPNAVPCVDCGHVWADGERRHEYDHHNGYDEPHWLDVEAVCTTCHAEREIQRR